MAAATSILYGPILVFQCQFPRLNRFSTFQLDFSRKLKLKKSISHCTLIPPKKIYSVENRADNEGVSPEGLEREALIHGSINFSSAGIQATLNSVSKWVIAAVFGIILLWRHDMQAVWATSGGFVNSCLATALKNILKHERPVSTLRSDPGMPSSHAQGFFYTVAFCIISIMATGFTGTSHVKPSGSGCSTRILFFHFLVLAVECHSHEGIYRPLLGS